MLDPLCGRLVAVRLELPAEFDLPGFYARAGFTVLGPFTPGAPRRAALPPLVPMSCVALCRAVLGAAAPFALTPFGLYRRLRARSANQAESQIYCRHKKNILTYPC